MKTDSAICEPHAIENQQKADSVMCKPHAMNKTANSGFCKV